jgi:hypothetical protein
VFAGGPLGDAVELVADAVQRAVGDPRAQRPAAEAGEVQGRFFGGENGAIAESPLEFLERMVCRFGFDKCKNM